MTTLKPSLRPSAGSQKKCTSVPSFSFAPFTAGCCASPQLEPCQDIKILWRCGRQRRDPSCGNLPVLIHVQHRPGLCLPCRATLLATTSKCPRTFSWLSLHLLSCVRPSRCLGMTRKCTGAWEDHMGFLRDSVLCTLISIIGRQICKISAMLKDQA